MQFKEENGRKRKREGTENRNTNEKEGEGGRTQHNLYIQKKERSKEFTRVIDITASDDKT